jgi:hypothetical protein
MHGKLLHGHFEPETSQIQLYAATLTSTMSLVPPAISKSTPGATVAGEQLKHLSSYSSAVHLLYTSKSH